MKKLIIFLTLIVTFSIGVNAQTLRSSSYIYEYEGEPGDSINATDSLFTKTILLNKGEGLYYNAKIVVSDATADAECTAVLKGKIFDTDDYTTITTQTWTGTDTDTTFVFTSNTNKVYYRYLQLEVEQVANSLLIDELNLSIKK